MLKIQWIVSNYPHALNEQAGIFYQILAEALVKSGVEITVIAPVPRTGSLLPLFSERYRAFNKSPEQEERNGVRIFRPRYWSHPKEANAGIVHHSILGSIKKLRLPPPDIIHGFGAYPASFVANIYAKQFGVPSVITFIGSDIHSHPHHSSANMKRLLRTIRDSDKIICVSRSLSNAVRELARKESEVVYMPVMPIDTTVFSRPETRRKYGWNQNDFLVLFVGYLYASKGINELCDALEDLAVEKDIFAVFAGGGSSLVKKIQSLKNAEWLGQLPHEKIMELMCAADLLVLPSYNEGIPGVVKEAGLVSLPVLATDAGGIGEVINDDRGYLIPTRNSAAIRNAIISIRKNYPAAKQKANALKLFIENEFLPYPIVTKQVGIYNELTGR
ncbi:MAG: glycosyltransferase [Crocinitomicaceae bacterium]|nr:glycosyltransferase [Crocinitomicaceae bacterium]